MHNFRSKKNTSMKLHFYLKVKNTELHPLTYERAQHCIDDRTTDFTLALMDFGLWNQKRDRDALSPNPDPSHYHYQWPPFLMSMLNTPLVWASWRRKVERSILSNLNTGKY